MKKFSFTTLILGIITIADLYFTGGMGGSVFLWMMYGFYKFITW